MTDDKPRKRYASKQGDKAHGLARLTVHTMSHDPVDTRAEPCTGGCGSVQTVDVYDLDGELLALPWICDSCEASATGRALAGEGGGEQTRVSDDSKRLAEQAKRDAARQGDTDDPIDF